MATKLEKTYILKTRRIGVRTNVDRTHYNTGTLARHCSYYGLQIFDKNTGYGSIKSIAGLIKKVNADYDYQYGCTYTVCSVELVKEVPEDVDFASTFLN